MKFTVEIRMGEVFVDGEFAAQLCWDADAVGIAIADYLKSKGFD